MMNRSELLKHGKKQAVEVEVKGIGKLWFRQPTAGEWEPIASEHARIFKETDGAGIPPAALMASTIATVLADQDLGQEVMGQGSCHRTPCGSQQQETVATCHCWS